MVPMYAGEVLTRMQSDTPGRQSWIEHPMGDILAARANEHDATRDAREADRADSHDVDDGYFATVWCHENFIRIDGREWVYWTLGTGKLLSKPEPLEDVYFHGQRPIVVGYSNLESHKVIPAGHAQAGGGPAGSHQCRPKPALR